MIYVSAKDFYEKVSSLSVMSRQEEIECARQMKTGDTLARERMIQSYLPMVASHIKKSHMQSLGMIFYGIQALEKAVDSFDFLQDSETFAHRLSWYLRQATTRYIADRSDENTIKNQEE